MCRAVGPDLTVRRAAGGARPRPVRRLFLDDQDAGGAVLANHFGLPPVERVNRIVFALEAAVGVVLLRFVRQDNHHLAPDVDALEVVVVVFGSGDAVAGEDERGGDFRVDTALPGQREVGTHDEVARGGGADLRPEVRLLAVELRLHHGKVLEVGGAGTRRFQSGAQVEAGDVLGGNAPFMAQGIAAAHLIGREEIDVALERVRGDRRQTGITIS